MIKRAVIVIITIYQRTISPDHGVFSFLFKGKVCRFYPTCSQYALDAVKRYGVSKGLVLAVKRIGRCHPFNEGGFDPVK